MPPEAGWYEPLVPVLADLLSACDEYGAGLAIIGGVAASALGQPRYTEDLDGTCDADPEDVEAFLEVLSRFSLVPRRSDFIELATKGRLLTLHHLVSATPVDLSCALLPFEHEVIERAILVPIGAIRVPIATPEDICIMKAVAATDRTKPKSDEQDIRQIIASNPALDVHRIRGYLPQFADALDRPEIPALFERLWREQHPGG